MTLNDLWHLPKTIAWIIYSIWATYLVSMRFLWVNLLEISCLQGFDLLTAGDLTWSLISTKNNRAHILTMGNPYSKYEITQKYRAWDMVFTGNIQCFYYLTSGDPKWPLISTKNDRDLLLNMGNLHAKYEIPRSYPSWDIVFTRFWPFDLSWPQMTFDLHQNQ